jgi:hypothetical protein
MAANTLGMLFIKYAKGNYGFFILLQFTTAKNGNS